ncbi:hypothetical protein HU200_045193 [Digitaria exilis]|uniref:Uncharacterized protein n=1 Tax=Digitaria exilis TaxID=1010633 RepID=A0A835B001_9POAL|nr:hypothetical protein HU200_045186 [Digitaria exilis]KAF8681756.1 hypothetical protein HU200_045193 [Digitaria exilis]CAB3498834.1 unnamed protein product [Digitaria exilis]
MAPMAFSPLHCLIFGLLLVQLACSVAIPPSGPSNQQHEQEPSKAAYIVYTDHLAKPSHFATHELWYTSMVSSLSPAAANDSSSRVFYLYDTVAHGFAAELTADEAQRLSNTTGVSGVFEDGVMQPHTTRSPSFLGLDRDFGILPDTNFGDDVIIGFVDTGIWPESASFADAGLAPVRRSRWKGRCEDGERFNASMCNNKLVGARFFPNPPGTSRDYYVDFQSPRDKAGHGTHVASTAAGSEVPGAELFGFAAGKARGVAPRARVAMYKACEFKNGCSYASVVAAVDAAVKDGVDILSMSLGGYHEPDFYAHPTSVALFGAVRAGVFVACSAGNDGPMASSLGNVAPWITTVGATNLDRLFPATIVLGNGQALVGQSLYTYTANQTPMVRLLPSNCTRTDLVPDMIMGKIVLCTDVGPLTGMAVQSAGGSGLISIATEDWGMEGLMVAAFTVPAVTIGAREAATLEAYVRSDPFPVASFRFTCGTCVGESRAPMVASYSSRGPNHIVHEVMKPDVVAPGTNILAAWPDETPLSGQRSASFNIISGTSMSCPHVAGVAALLRNRHRDWTPAMIRSAMMTTAATLDSQGRPIADSAAGARGGGATPMAAGAGFVRPQQAMDPGLVYDAGEKDYVELLCTMNYTAEQIGVFVPGFAGCTATLPGGVVGGLNYPSFVADLSNGNGTGFRVLARTVIKVSEGPETYTAKVVAPDQLVEVTVTPATLEFAGQRNERKSYSVVFRSKKRPAAGLAQQFGEIVWESDVHRVRSPVAFIWD